MSLDDPGVRRSTPASGCTRSARASRWTSSGSRRPHDLGIGQVPRRDLALRRRGLPDGLPVALQPGEYNLSDPNAAPGQTVTHSLLDFQTRARGPQGEAHALAAGLLARPHLHARRRAGAGRGGALACTRSGFLLWNAGGPLRRRPRCSRLHERYSRMHATGRCAIVSVNGGDARDRAPDGDSGAQVEGDPRAEGARRRRPALDLPAGRRSTEAAGRHADRRRRQHVHRLHGRRRLPERRPLAPAGRRGGAGAARRASRTPTSRSSRTRSTSTLAERLLASSRRSQARRRRRSSTRAPRRSRTRSSSRASYTKRPAVIALRGRASTAGRCSR